MPTNPDPQAKEASTICRCGHSYYEHDPYPEDDGPYYACEYGTCNCEDFNAD